MAPSDLRARLMAALERDSGASSDFDLNPATVLPEGRKLRGAGVLAGILDGDAGPQLVLTKRSSVLKHHPGQIAFPGGKVEPIDPDATAAALREAQEEIGLDPANVEVLGTLPPHETVTGFTITPVIALIRAEFTAVAEPGEVAEVFRVPLAHVTDPANYMVQSRHWRGTRRHYYTVPYGPYYIWGATARILRGLAARMAG
ncbi:CoA pyrophosphatase [Oceaniglobus roseus]|uniref:CoA pyrophosphatase n=1 Tax=Oceaniglobus roseus TaxID=1737570 RepID=UPI001FE6B2C3|nr:CoA pyrophosphatase [Kandeliimicrobium roseum]